MKPRRANRPPARYRKRRGLAITGLYLLLGPLAGAAGGALAFSLIAAANALIDGRAGQIGLLLSGGLTATFLVALPIAYGIGLPSSLLTGLVVALDDRKARGVSWSAALLGAGIAWSLTAVLTVLVVPPDGQALWLAGLLAAHLMAATACTLAARRMFATQVAPEKPGH